jgi:hypothetical protein
MRSLFLLSLLLLGASPRRSHDLQFSIDPTGTYILKGIIKKNNITGHFGEMRVRLLDQQTAAFCFYINNGYPDYASAAIEDTLRYNDDKILYKPGRDSTCSLIFFFALRKVDLMEIYSDPHSGCGFASGVLAPLSFDKVSSEIPVIQDLSNRGQASPGSL